MAQAQPEEEHIQETQASETTKNDESGTSSAFRFNAQAPEFVPRSHTPQTQNQSPAPVSGYYLPCFQYVGAGAGGSVVGVGAGASDWIYLGDQELIPLVSNPNVILPNYNNHNKKDVLTDDVQQKIIKQVEYQFSDMSLLANENLVKQINKDPEGFVPMSVVASTKKIKALNCGNHVIAQALQSSSKLVVSSDHRRVRRKNPFTDKDKEDLQSRTVVAENLPDDHSHQSLEKIFGVAGSVKTIRICHPQEPNSSRPKGGDFFISNKLHALIEYKNTDMAENAVDKLNDERNWRQGLRVRLMLRRSPKSVLKSRRSDFDGYFDDEDSPPELQEDSSQPINSEGVADNNAEDCLAGSKKGWGRGRGKSRPRAQGHHGRGLLTSPQLSCSFQSESTAKPMKGPRMPDGTRGFTMGRGKPMKSPIEAGLALD